MSVSRHLNSCINRFGLVSGPGTSAGIKFNDPQVCKSFLYECCPHEILASTVRLNLLIVFGTAERQEPTISNEIRVIRCSKTGVSKNTVGNLFLFGKLGTCLHIPNLCTSLPLDFCPPIKNLFLLFKVLLGTFRFSTANRI